MFFLWVIDMLASLIEETRPVYAVQHKNFASIKIKCLYLGENCINPIGLTPIQAVQHNIT